MDNREAGRRGFIKKSVALAGWAAADGAGLAKGQTADSATEPAKDLEAYGERWLVSSSVRIFPPPFDTIPSALQAIFSRRLGFGELLPLHLCITRWPTRASTFRTSTRHNTA